VRIVYLVLITFLVNIYVRGSGANTCHQSLNTLLAQQAHTDEAQEFLKLQSKLTLHKLAFALVREDNLNGSFRLENEILKIAKEIQKKEQTSAKFNEIVEEFDKNKLSRTALARIAPLVKDLINNQLDITDSDRRKSFAINERDLKVLAILAEKEEKDAQQLYQHKLFKDASHDNSILNFTKVVNSSLRDRKNYKNIKQRFSKEIAKIEKQIAALVNSLPLDQECKELLQCVTCNDKVSESTKLFNATMDILSNNGVDKHKKLRYDDFWLHISTKPDDSPVNPTPVLTDTTEENQQVVAQESYEYRETAPEIPTTEVDHKEMVMKHLIDKVIAHYSYFFTEEDLREDEELLLAIAQAIDRGSKTFSYKGTVYDLPEAYNKRYDLDGDEIEDDSMYLSARAYWDNDEVEKFKNQHGFSNEDAIEFFKVRYSLNNAGQNSFEFKDKIYDYKTGKILNRDIASFLSYKSKDQTQSENGDSFKSISQLSNKDLEIMSESITSGNNNYEKEEKVFYISGVEVDLKKLHQKHARDYDQRRSGKYASSTPWQERDLLGALLKLSDKLGKVFGSKPKIKDIEAYVKLHPELKIPLTRALANRHDVIKVDDKLIRTATLDVIPGVNYTSTILQNVSNPDIGSTHQEPQQFNLTRAEAIVNKRPFFNYQGKSYSTSNGRLTSDGLDRGDGYINYKTKKMKIAEMNKLNDRDLVISYHQNFKNNKCNYYTIVDKKNNSLTVYDNEGNVKFNKEVLLGNKEGDQRTMFYENSQGQKTSKTNGKTGAGIYTTGDFKQSSQNGYYARNYNNNLLALKIEQGAYGNGQNEEAVLAFHAVPNGLQDRILKVSDGKSKNNRETNGCINIQEQDFVNYKQNYDMPGCPFYVLPEDENNRFTVENDKIRFIPKDGSCAKETGQCHGDYYYSPYSKKEAKKIKFNPLSKYRSPLITSFLGTLETEKEELMRELRLSNDEYNDLAIEAFAVLGIESGFGNEKMYAIKEAKIGSAEVGDVLVSTFKSILRNDSANSQGLSQIKNVSDYLKGTKYENITESQLTDPKYAAIATMAVLKEKLAILKNIEHKHGSITPENRMDYLYYVYNGSTRQIKTGAATPLLNERAREIRKYKSVLALYEEK
jgi:hypothetical protein